jgi:hypothetical protein
MSDRDRFPSELQSLVMRSALEWIYERCDGTITIIPEAWEFLPQGRGSPVKLAAVELIRKGAGMKNFVWLDSQDIGGVEKEVLRSCPVWLLGVQRETNEIKRVLDNIPHPTAKPRPSDVARLKKGEFYACFGDTVVKTYVQPAWMTGVEAEHIATGVVTVSEARRPPIPINAEDDMKETNEKLDALIGKQDKLIDVLGQFIKGGVTAQRAADEAVASAPPSAPLPSALPSVGSGVIDEEALYQRFKARLAKEAPAIIKVLAITPEIEVTEKRTIVQADTEGARGMVAVLLKDGFFDEPKTPGAAWKELQRRWNYKGISVRLTEQMNWYCANGFVTNEATGFLAVPGIKSRITKA